VTRYALAYVIPGAAFLGLALGGWWTWLAVIQSYVLFPFLDWIIPGDPRNPTPALEHQMSSRLGYRILAGSAVPIQVILILFGGYVVTASDATVVEVIGGIAVVGLSSGAFGIVAAHELMHQRRMERWLARILMSSVTYAHFCIEHVQGHHVHVGTPADPASAPPGQSIYRFLLRTTIGSWRSAWRLEASRLARKGLPVWHPGNRMLQDALVSVALNGGAVLLWGWMGLVFFLAQSAIAILQLEAINYIEHYGLRRRETTPGVYEPATTRHSWNTHRRLTNAALFNLGRHADHHNHAGRRYQILLHECDAPQMPAGYAAMLMMAFFPPLWRRVMDPRAAAAMQTSA
jgi:alkane 1-monooxygenase